MVLSTTVQSESPTFLENKRQMLALLSELDGHWKMALAEGENKAVERHHALGKMTARERIQSVLDPHSPFFELMPLAGLLQNDSTPGASLVCGIGIVEGRFCLVTANVPTIKGGAINRWTLLKMKRVARIAHENRLPLVYLVESAGADLPNQAEVYNYGGTEFRDLTRRSKDGIPTIAVVFGSSTAGGAYIPGMSDYVIMVKDKARVYLAGPPLVKMALGETIDDEDLGGAQMHAQQSGLADFLAEDEKGALAKARELVSLYPRSHFELPEEFEPPCHNPDDLLGVVSTDLKVSYDAREVISRVIDGSRFVEFKPLYGETLVTGFARIYGHDVGILANNGVLFSQTADKGTQFIQLCNQQNKPIVFLQNITGFMVGRESEHQGIIRAGAKLINAVSNSEVPALTVITGASYGAGNYAMCGLAFEPRFLLSYPQARLAVMGPDQLAGVMELIQRERAAKLSAEEKEKMETQNAALKQMVHDQSSAFYCTGRVWDDGIIDPRQTRSSLGFLLTVINQIARQPSGRFGVFRM